MIPSSNKTKPSLILASGSPRRNKLLKQLGLPFAVQPSTVDEDIDPNLQPSHIVQTLALRKARDVANQYPYAVIIGADTIVVHRGKILGKPTDQQHARTILSELRGTTHHVLTGVALIKTDDKTHTLNEKTFYESTSVRFGTPNMDDINKYVASGSPMDKAGAYGIQDNWGSIFVKRIEGDYNNIVGLPLYRLNQHLKNFAPELIKS